MAEIRRTLRDTAASGSRTTEAADTRSRATNRDWSLVAILAALVLVVTTLPYIYAYLSAPPEWHFNGMMQDVPDTLQYWSWMRDHRSAVLVPNRMTAEPNQPALFNLLWLVLGRIQVLTGWSVPALFGGLRLVAGAALLLVLWPVCGLFTHTRSERWSAYLVAVFGAGLGWVWIVDKYLNHLPDPRFPLDVFVAEPNTFLIILGFPHFVVATTLILSIFMCFVLALRRPGWLLPVAAALLALLLTLQHAYDLLIIGLVPAGALGLLLLRDRRIPWRGVATLALIGCVAAPPAAYFTLLTTSNPLWRRVLAQFANAGVYSPPLWRLLIVMGVPFIFVLLGVAWNLVRRVRHPADRETAPRTLLGRLSGALQGQSEADLFLWSWFVVGLLLLYIPTDFQIHMFTAWQIPVALLAVGTLYRRLIPALAQRLPSLARFVPVLLLILVLPTNLYLFSWRFVELGRHEAPYYLTTGEDAALTWLDQHADHNSVILSGLSLGQYVPARSDGRAFLAHWAQTVDFFAKGEQVRSFFATTTDDSARRVLLRDFAITYVLYGNEERTLGNYDIAHSPLLQVVYTRDEVTIYQVLASPR